MTPSLAHPRERARATVTRLGASFVFVIFKCCAETAVWLWGQRWRIFVWMVSSLASESLRTCTRSPPGANGKMTHWLLACQTGFTLQRKANDVGRTDRVITAHCQCEIYPNVGLVASSITSRTGYFKYETINNCLGRSVFSECYKIMWFPHLCTSNFMLIMSLFKSWSYNLWLLNNVAVIGGWQIMCEFGLKRLTKNQNEIDLKSIILKFMGRFLSSESCFISFVRWLLWFWKSWFCNSGTFWVWRKKKKSKMNQTKRETSHC